MAIFGMSFPLSSAKDIQKVDIGIIISYCFDVCLGVNIDFVEMLYTYERGYIKSMNQCNIIEEWIDIRENDILAVADYLRSEPISIIDGGIMSEFERAFAEFIGTKYAVAYCNGTAALHAAAFAIGANSSTSVILSQYSYHGTVNAVLENGAKVILCDYDPETLNIDCTEVEKCISKDTVGMVITHCWGNPVDMDSIKRIKLKYGIKVISDASHAHGAKWNGRTIGSLATEDIACFSLGKNKLISAGELGIAVTNDVRLYDSLLFMGHPNRVPSALKSSGLKDYPNGIGNKYRPHPLSMVLAMQQLRRYPEKLERNIRTNELLTEMIGNIRGYTPIKSYVGAKRVFWKTQFRMDEDYWRGISPDLIIQALLNKGMPLQQFHNYSIKEHEQIWSHKRYEGQVVNLSHQDTPDNIIVLPGFVQISSDSIEQIVSAFSLVSFNKGDL